MPPARTVAIAAAVAVAAAALAAWQTQAAAGPAAEAGAGSAGGIEKDGEATLPGTGPCGEGFYLSGDICEPAPPGYVETRSECEMAVDSMEAAGVEQDYMAEIAKCRGG